MSSGTIPKAHWREELDAFSRDHEGWRVDVRVSTAEGLRTETHDLPLVGISCDAPGSPRISVVAGERIDDHLTHEIPNAVSIDIEDSGVSIRAADGSRTEVEFRRPR